MCTNKFQLEYFDMHCYPVISIRTYILSEYLASEGYICRHFLIIIAGGIHGVGYVMAEHQKKDLFKAICAESFSKMQKRKEVVIGERNLLYHPFQKLGMSNYIILNTLSDKQNIE